MSYILSDHADDGEDTLTVVVGFVACAILTTILVCICRLRREERELIRRNLLQQHGRSSSNVTELSSTADGIVFDQRPLEGLEEARAAQEARAVQETKAASARGNKDVAAAEAPATRETEAETASDGLPAEQAPAVAVTAAEALAAASEEPPGLQGQAGSIAADT